MSNSKSSPGGVHVEREIVRPTVSVVTQSIAALPEWVMLQVRPMLDAQGLNPVIFDTVSAVEALGFIRTSPLADLASSKDSLAAQAQLALRDLALARDPLTWLLSAGPIRDNCVATDSGGIYMQDYANDYVEFQYVGEAITNF